MASKKFDVEIKVDGNGNVDIDQTLAAFRPQVEQYRTLTECDVEKVNSVLNSLFTTPGIVMNTKATISLAMSVLWNKDPSSFAVLEKRIHETLSSSDILRTEKGPGKGVRKATEAEVAYRAEHGEWPKQEKKSA